MRGQRMTSRTSPPSLSEELRVKGRESVADFNDDDDQDEELRNIRRFEKEARAGYDKAQEEFKKRASKNAIPTYAYVPHAWMSRPSKVGNYYICSDYQPSKSKKPKEEAYKITRTNGKKYIDKKPSLANKIFAILKTKQSLHINDIIIALKKKGLLENELHSYAIVYRTLSRNLHLFIKIDKGVFAIRNGFRKRPDKVPAKKDAVENIDDHSLQALLIAAVKEISPGAFTTPTEVLLYLQTFKFVGSYDNVYSGMQSSNFVKSGLNYRLKKHL